MDLVQYFPSLGGFVSRFLKIFVKKFFVKSILLCIYKKKFVKSISRNFTWMEFIDVFIQQSCSSKNIRAITKFTFIKIGIRRVWNNQLKIFFTFENMSVIFRTFFVLVFANVTIFVSVFWRNFLHLDVLILWWWGLLKIHNGL